MSAYRSVKPIVLNEAACPINEKALTHFNLQEPKDMIRIAMKLPLVQRLSLCQFCYSRAHLYSLALHIASTCDLKALKETFGTAGEIIFQQSRNVEVTLSELKQNESCHEKKPVSLPPLCSRQQ